jgi:hypothetical protein
MKKINSDEPDYNYLNWRLMATVGSGNVRRVKAILALGADPNHRHVGNEKGSYRDPRWEDLTPGVFPLALVLLGQKQGNQAPILDLLLAAGASLSTCFSWLSVDAPRKELRFDYMLEMCELIYASPNRSLHVGFIQTWLAQTSDQINHWPEPQDWEFEDMREIHVALHERLIAVCKLYLCQHVPAPWVTAMLL